MAKIKKSNELTLSNRYLAGTSYLHRGGQKLSAVNHCKKKVIVCWIILYQHDRAQRSAQSWHV